MAAPVKKMVGASDDSSSSDDEVLQRCQEAVWETRPDKEKDGASSVKETKRTVVADHEHDGNELQVSQGFRTHVAKKLGHILDSYITETQTETASCVESAKCDHDEGFRLFSTSVPGQTVTESPAPVRHRPVPSSSDSDSEMETRLREAAVSVKDLLPSSTLPSTLSPPSTEPPCPEKSKKKKRVAEGEESQVKVKKRKKKKQNQESPQVDRASSPLKAQSNGNSEQEHTQVKWKKKNKKKREGQTKEVQ